MTGFVIYSMGDPDFIRLAILGLSHAFEQGALSLAKIGLMLGLLAAFWQGIWNPGKIEFKQFFIGFFLVIILFGKSVPVTLIHGDGVGADAMPPIPIGIALGGTIATNFGHAMADSLRQFYHTAYVPGSAATGSYRAMIGADGGGGQAVPVAGNGLQPFRELMKLRFDGNLDSFTSTSAYLSTSSSAQSGTGSAPAGGTSKNISKSIENYLSDCVLKDIYNQRNVQEVNEESMQTSPWAWGAMKVSYNGWTTSVNVDSGHGWKGVGCGTAYTKITGALETEWKQITESAGSTKGSVNEAIANYGQAMLGSTNAQAWKIKVNQVLMYHFKKAKTRSRWSSQAELMASQAEFEALDKRRVSSGVQYSLWSEMAIPLMTYIEAFVFLIGPLMPFIVAFGEKGAGMVLKYFFLLIWVNTWPILQVGVNMYLQNAINKASFGSMTYDAFSWSGFNTTFTEIESFIAMGSTLQTMVPALSLMLLYGSVHTAINMSNSAQKGGGSEGAMATPKAASSADSGKLSVGNTNYAHDAHVGGVVQSYSGSNAAPIGMSQNNTKTDLSAATANNIQAAKTQAAQASTASTQSITEMTNMMKVGSDGKSMQLTEGATRSQGMQRANAYADSLMKIEGMNEQDAKSLGLALAGGMGVKAQAEAAAALGFSAKAGDAKGGGEVSSSGKFGVGVKGEISAQATSKLDTAISNVASLSEQKGNNWSFSNTEQGSAVLASAEQLSTSNATGNTAGFGKSGQELEQSSKQWTDANSLVESESRSLSAINGFSGGTSYNLAGVTSDAAQNRNDEKLADGSLLSTHARNTAFGSMNAEQKSDFDKFKKEGGYGKGLNGDIQALKDFSQTKEGASLAGMSSNFKTTQENAAGYEKAIAADVGGDKSLQARREATGRYADAAFKNIMATYGSERFEASAKFLDQLNANAGGKMANWTAAADDFRSMGNKAEQPLSMPAPQTAEEAGGPTASSVAAGNNALNGEAQNFVAAKGAAVTATNPNATHAANVQTVTQQNQADPNKVKAANDLGQKVDARVPQDGFVEGLTQPLTQANRDAGAVVAQMGGGVADVTSTLNNWVNGTAQEQAAAQLVQDGNVSTNTAALMTGGGSQTAHSEIVDRMKTGLSEDASSKERQAAIELLAASHAAGNQIESLRATGNAEDAKIADSLQQNANSVNAALKASPFDDTQKEVLKGLGEKVANGELSTKSANAGFEMMNNDKYDAAKTQHQASVATRGTSYRQLENNQLGGKAAMEVLESKGLINSEEYKSLQQKSQDNQNVLDSHVKSRAVLDAQEAYRQVNGNHVHMTESRPIANAIISSSINGSDYKGLKDASMNEAMKGDNQDNKSFLNYFKNSDDNIDAMKKYENVREGLVAASDRLRSDPKMEQYADRLDATIAKLDKQTGFDQRVAEPEPKPSSTEAGGQGTGGVNPPTSNQSTVTAQNNAASNSTVNSGSNGNGEGTGDHQATPGEGAATTQNTDSS
ncbi:conjugal transfer protein TraG N-terminal domain-containing protein, partial [Vibrio pomeroyi]